MAKSEIVWIFIASFCYIHQSVCTGEANKSKACYGVHGIPCTEHCISCSSYKKIAIYDAYYTDNTECAVTGISNCVNVNPDNVTEHGYHRFNNAEMMSLFQNCSTATQCVYYAPRRQPDRAFSIVKYRCIDSTYGDFLNISKGSAKGVSHVTLFHKDTELSSSTMQTNRYMCSFKSNLSSTSISMYVLDAQLRLGTQRQCLSQLSVLHGNYIASSNCSTVFQPFRRLNVTREITLHIYFKDTPRLSARLIWLLVNASHPFNVTCETVEQTTTGTNSVTAVSQVPSTNYSLSESSRTTTLMMTHQVVSTVTVDNNTHGEGHTANNTGAIAGGVVAIVLAVLAVSLVSVWIIRHRQKNSKENSKTAPLSKDANHDVTYSLAGNIQQINYHEIQDLGTRNSDYDYATADGMVLPQTTNTYFTIEPAGKLSLTENSTAGGDYDHIGDRPSQTTGDYDTTASVTEPGSIGEDSYGYNHFERRANPQTHQNDYDTAASATRAVAKITTTERNTDEDDYDHFHRGTNAPETVSSPYDTTSGVEENSDYAVAGQMK